MLALIVDVHRAAEDHHRVVSVWIGRRVAASGDQPLLELVSARRRRLGEDARAGVGLLDYRENPHLFGREGPSAG